MLLKVNSTDPLTAPSVLNEPFVHNLIGNKQYTEAYSILSSYDGLSVSGLYNLGLCLYLAEEYDRALLKLDELYLRLEPIRLNHIPENEDAIRKSIYLKQSRTDTHLCPVLPVYADSFPVLFKESVLRLKIDCLVALGNWNQVIETSTHLTYKNYQHVENALQEAANNLK